MSIVLFEFRIQFCNDFSCYSFPLSVLGLCSQTVELIVIGMYEDQLYIQPSVQMMREVEAAACDAIQQGSVDMPRVRWNPYIMTGLSTVLCILYYCSRQIAKCECYVRLCLGVTIIASELCSIRSLPLNSLPRNQSRL